MGTLVITQKGIAASANASAGGFLIDITLFSIGDGTATPQRTDTGLSGRTLYSGSVSLIEVLDGGVAIFTLELPIGTPITGDSYNATEVSLHLADGTMFAKGLFESPITKPSNIAMRVYAFLMGSADCDLTTINVSVGTIVSIPAVAAVRLLPAPNSGVHNVYSVLDLKENSDGSNSAALAVRYGANSMYWSFIEWSRYFCGTVANIVTSSPTQSFKVNVNASLAPTQSRVVIGQIISGPGQGQSRKLHFDYATSVYTVQEANFSSITTGSTIALWKPDSGSDNGSPIIAGCHYPPDMDMPIPVDWVLTRGPGECPIWMPPQIGPGASGISRLPGTLLPSVFYFTGNGRTRHYDTRMGESLETGLVWVSLDGIMQHVDAYDLQGTKVVFSEYVPSGVSIEIIVYSRDTTSTTGETWDFHVSNFITDGVTTHYSLGTSTLTKGSLDVMKKYVYVFLSGIKQFGSSYRIEVIDTVVTVVFNEAPPATLDLQITWISTEAKPGYTVDLITNTFIGTGNQETYNLSLYPEDRRQLFVSISGIALHNIDANFTLHGNQLTIPVAITKGLPIQVLIFTNLLTEGQTNTKFSGVVTGAISSHTYVKLLRYNAPDIHIPFQKVNIEPLDGISVIGEYPNFKIKNTNIPKPRSQRLTPTRYSTLHTANDSEEIIYVYKFTYDDDMIVTVTADFACRLGPGFYSEEGYEFVEYVLGFKTLTSSEAPYGRRIKGTGMAGFNYLNNGQYAYANASVTQTYELLLDNNKLKNVTFVAKMRIKNGSVSKYRSLLDINFSLLALPKYGD